MKKDTRVRPYPHFKFPDEIVISFEKLDSEGCKWYGLPEGSFKITADNYGWFPTAVLMGTVNGKFADTKRIGANVGGNLGSASIGVKDIETAIALLTIEGYIIDNDLK